MYCCAQRIHGQDVDAAKWNARPGSTQRRFDAAAASWCRTQEPAFDRRSAPVTGGWSAGCRAAGHNARPRAADEQLAVQRIGGQQSERRRIFEGRARPETTLHGRRPGCWRRGRRGRFATSRSGGPPSRGSRDAGAQARRTVAVVARGPGEAPASRPGADAPREGGDAQS